MPIGWPSLLPSRMFTEGELARVARPSTLSSFVTTPSDRLAAALAGRYRLERELGAGGMATVYLAFDEKHDRKVAIKVLKPELAAVLGAERFVVEIKTTAAMSHPHILPLFDSGEADGFLYYVMPYIEGETIRGKLTRETQFGIDEAVRITREVADALDYAHRHGIIHRDIKPENILLHDGRAMVMDFGIALAVSAAAGGRMTETGLSLGTPHYMSPEQATAEKEITGRTDQYSLASVLYEMLAGEPPHSGGSAQAIIMKIIAEPAQSVTKLRKSVPPNVAAAIDMALQKVPADRFESAKAFAEALANASFVGTLGAHRDMPRGVTRSRLRDPVFLAMSAVACGALAVAVTATMRSRADDAPVRVTRVALSMPEAQSYSMRGQNATLRHFALSPDGSVLIYRSVKSDTTGIQDQLWRRRLDELSGSPIPGTEGAELPRFSVRGDFVSFVARDRVGVMPTQGGPIDWLPASTMSGAAWGDDGALYFTRQNRIARWAPDGGDPVDFPFDVQSSAIEVLPGSRAVLMWPAGQMTAIDLSNGKKTTLGLGTNPRYVPGGYIVFSRIDNGAVAFQPFDTRSLRTRGQPVSTVDVPAEGLFDVAADGSLVYLEDRSSPFTQLAWVDRTGQRAPIDWIAPARYDQFALSPRGDKIVGSIETGPGAWDLWVYDLTSRVRLPITRDGLSRRARWHPTESALLFVHDMLSERSSLKAIPADGSGSAQPLVRLTSGASDAQWTRDGKDIVIRMPGASARNIFRFVPGKDSTPVPFLNRRFMDRNPVLSPDGRWLVYTSDQSGRDEVYAQPYPSGGAVTPISLAGGSSPVWSRDGRELFYIGNDGHVWAARISLGDATFRVESRTRLFSFDGIVTDTHRSAFEVGPDGRFLVQLRSDDGTGVRLVLVRNWLQSVTAEKKR